MLRMFRNWFFKSRMSDSDTGVRIFAEIIEEQIITDLELGVVIASQDVALGEKLQHLRLGLRAARALK